ncbi:hypothetical protein [Cellulomonas xiejunii]|uniref:Uncharacterized protein n=1 Tax=Cellulomonas xiejunii TaxID=2968083 RepID=A0ABY5KRH0_9CELL|nr:hypothetical protein [Cellulomonas xiejunii]MCC2315726.1 hypothetical protein [Cellulomonas xiejunii]MCC2321790.1 hypothetical protein [Cellulomonas xiejunii]UUI73097.1 hypothetical protein NP048_06555 [Cellulomonas xiejunii]
MTHHTLRDHLTAALDAAEPDLAGRLEQDPRAYLDLVSLVRDASGATDAMLRDAVASARAAGCTWNDLGGVLGMSRQAAQQRFAPATEPAPDDRARDSAVLAPLTAFNEMRVLARAGRYGWHCVGYGAGYHVVERDDRQWEHLRTSFGRHPGGDWQRVGQGWGWWAYWARPTDLPRLPGDPSVAAFLVG